MKIKYDLSKNFFKTYNEINGIISLKKKILEEKNVKIKGFIRQLFDIIIYCDISIFAFVCFLDLCGFNIANFSLLFDLAVLIFLVVMYHMHLFFIQYRKNKELLHIGELEINSEGIVDKSDSGLSVSVIWSQIEALVISKNAIVFIVKNSLWMIFINNECKNQLLKAIKKYNKELKIFDYTE